MDQQSDDSMLQSLVDKMNKMNLDIIREICTHVVVKTMTNFEAEEHEKKEIASMLIEEVLLGKDSKKIPKENNRCMQILKSGKNAGKRCSITRKKGSDYCTRHLNMIMGKGDGESDKQKGKILAKVIPSSSPKFSKYGDSDVYIDKKHGLIAIKKDGKYVVGASLHDENVVYIDTKSKAMCDIFNLRVEEDLYDQIMELI